MARVNTVSVQVSEMFATSVNFALESADFGPAEGERYLALAFERDCGVEYGLMSRRLNQLGKFDAERAAGAAIRAYFGQRLWVLASLATDWPKEVFLPRVDGLDLCKNGLAMAVASGRSDAARALTKAIESQPQAWERMGAAFLIAQEISDPQVQSVLSWDNPTENATHKKLVEQIIAECEKSALDSFLPHVPKAKRGAKSI